MKLSSSAFSHDGQIPKVYSCQGKNVNPPLSISDVPKEAKSLVLIMDDPDVPEWVRKEKMYDHWIIYDIDPTLTTISENDSSFGVQGKNTGGKIGYTGPCPPDREHRYFFKLYALDTKLFFPEGLSKDEVMQKIEGHILTKAELMGRYEKS